MYFHESMSEISLVLYMSLKEVVLNDAIPSHNVLRLFGADEY
jgi:hypothetical protein